MESENRSWDLVEHLLDASVNPERLHELISVWDSRIEHSGLEGVRLAEVAGSGFAQQIAGVLQILERVQAAELRRVTDLLSTFLGAAMVLAADGSVVAANEAASALFGLKPGKTIDSMPLSPAAREEFAARIAEVAVAKGRDENVVCLHPTGLERTVLAHLKAIRNGGSHVRVLAVTSEVPWPAAVSEFLGRAFALTAAEIGVLRSVVAGGTVAGIAAVGGRSPGTVRSQLHAIMQKTGTQSQAELVRLAILLIQSVPVEVGPRTHPAPEPNQRFLRMPDGRRIEVLTFGDPGGRPVIWMQSTYGFWRLPRAAEADFARRRLKVVVPFRAGWCGSDSPPEGGNALELAVADLRALMLQLRIASAVVVAPGDDIRIALMLTHADPARVVAIFGIASGFPIRTDAQHRRLIPIARFVRACARYSPSVLPFMLRMLKVAIARYGIEAYLRGMVARVPADARAFADPEIASAWVSAAERMYLADSFRESAVAAEFVLSHQDWPAELGHVACPVTLIHGEQDGNAPFETALEYCAMHPEWRLVAYPDEGEFVAHVRWRDVLDLIEQSFLAPPDPR
jgi:pimeloyl-ACP methyl ester carboxylesterase/DNA-binding CsgD family transcriptional regulator